MSAELMNIADFPTYDEYKDSGVEWLGEVPKEWETSKLKFVSSIINGDSISPSIKDRFVSTDSNHIPYIASKDIDVNNHSIDYENGIRILLNWSGYKVAKKQSALICIEGGSAGRKIAYLDQDVCFVNKLASLYTNKLNKKYLFYTLLAKPFQYQFGVSLSGLIGGVAISQIKNMAINVPSIYEQTLIAQFLDQKTALIDQAIAIKEQQIKLLKERKQIIIQQAVTQGLNPNAPMKDSGVEWIGQIPEHWEVRKVKHIFKLVMDAAEKNNNHELLSVYTDIGVKPRRELEERGNKASTTDGYWMVKKGDIIVNKLLAWMGAIGLSEYDGVTSPAYDILRASVPIDGMFYHLLFRSEFCSRELKRHSRGIMDMRLRLYFDKFGNIEVLYPPYSEQQLIVDSIKGKFAEIERSSENLNKQIQALKEYKITLINSAVTGKIKITKEMV